MLPLWGATLYRTNCWNALTRAFARRGGHARLFEGYGLTETVTVCCVNTHANNRADSVGKPLPGLQVAAFEGETRLPAGSGGELYVAGNTLMLYYRGDEPATAATFYIDEHRTRWVRTGDYGYVDADGFVFFKQRIKRIVKVSGVSVFPSEIEQLVMRADGVTAVCALPVPDAKHGSMIKLFVASPDHALPAAAQSARKQTLSDEIAARLGAYARPKEVVFLPELPTTGVGKIDAQTLLSL